MQRLWSAEELLVLGKVRGPAVAEGGEFGFE
jgi:hypothetical protein